MKNGKKNSDSVITSQVFNNLKFKKVICDEDGYDIKILFDCPICSCDDAITSMYSEPEYYSEFHCLGCFSLFKKLYPNVWEVVR